MVLKSDLTPVGPPGCATLSPSAPVPENAAAATTLNTHTKNTKNKGPNTPTHRELLQHALGATIADSDNAAAEARRTYGFF